MTDVWNDQASRFTSIKMDVADINSALASKLIDLQINGISKFAVNKLGEIVNGTLTIPQVDYLEDAITALSAAGITNVDVIANTAAILATNTTSSNTSIGFVYADPDYIKNDYYTYNTVTTQWTNTGIIPTLLENITPRKRVERTFYVTMNGNDETNHGQSIYKPKATIGAALQAAKDTGEACVVIVHPGEYPVDALTEIPAGCALYGYDVRVTKVYPNWDAENIANNMFLLTNGCKVRGFTFQGLRHEAFTLSAPPTKGYAFVFKPGEYITRSPYIADCTQIHDFTYQELSLPIDRDTGNPLCPRGGGNLYADGTVLDTDSPLRSVVVDSFTAVNPNGVGYAVVNDALVQLVSVFTNWSRVGVWAHAGGQVTTTNSNTTFGDYAFASTGFRYVVKIDGVANTQTRVACANVGTYIQNNISTLVPFLMEGYSAIGGYTEVIGSNTQLANLTSRDTTTLLTEVADDLKSGQDRGMIFFLSGLFTANSIGPSADSRYELVVTNPEQLILNEQVYTSNSTTQFIANGIIHSIDTSSNTVVVKYTTSAFSKDLYLNLTDDNTVNTFIEAASKTVTPPDLVFREEYKEYFLRSWDIVRDELKALTSNTLIYPESGANNFIDELFTLANNVISTPENYTVPFQSKIEASSQQFSYAGSGVNYNALPFSQRASGVAPDPTSNLYTENGGVIYATFSTEQGDTYLGKDLRIDFERSTIEGQAFSRGVQNITLPLIVGIGG